MQKLYIHPKTSQKANYIFHSLHKHIALILFFCTNFLTAQWDTQSPIPTFLDVRGVGAPTAERVFIATEDNSFDNGGALFRVK